MPEFPVGVRMNNNDNKRLPILPYLCKAPALLALILLGELLALVLILASPEKGFSWARLGTFSLITQWIILCCTLVLCQARPLLNRLRPFMSGIIAYGICLSIIAVVLLVAQMLISPDFQLELWLKGFLIAGIFAGILLRYLYLQQQLSNQQQAELHARLQALQSRIRPHFLFNSMNTIASLISINPVAAEKAVEDLSHLFRSSLQAPALVPLQQEIDLCQRYIAIEQQRLGERLSMQWDLAVLEKYPHLAILPLPSLSLQPLLENAIVHGIQHLAEGGVIEFNIDYDQHYLTINIHNPLGYTASSASLDLQDKGNQIALDNIEHRLQLHYEGAASIHVNNANKDYTVSIRIPVKPIEAIQES